MTESHESGGKPRDRKRHHSHRERNGRSAEPRLITDPALRIGDGVHKHRERRGKHHLDRKQHIRVRVPERHADPVDHPERNEENDHSQQPG